MPNKLISLSVVLSMAAGCLAMAGERDGVIFDTRVGAGVYNSNSAQSFTNPVLDISGALVIGDMEGSKVGIDLGMTTAVRDGGATVATADVALRGRYLPGDSKFGFEGSIPFRYRKDDNYYEFSAIEVSAIMKVAEGDGHQLLAKIGINPFTKRTYGNDYGSYRTNYDPAAVSDGWFHRPSGAVVYGAPGYAHDSRADNTYADNRDVYFGGGTMTRTVDTGFDTAEYSVRIPVTLEYKYKSKDEKLVIQAVAYYQLRAGVDKLTQNDRYLDHYQGYVSYSNVNWQTCYDRDGGTYLCNPFNTQYSGAGELADRYDVNTDLQSKGFVGHQFGGKVDASYSIYKDRVLELLLNVQARAEVDTHVMDAVGEAHTSTRFIGTGGAIVRF